MQVLEDVTSFPRQKRQSVNLGKSIKSRKIRENLENPKYPKYFRIFRDFLGFSENISEHSKGFRKLIYHILNPEALYVLLGRGYAPLAATRSLAEGVADNLHL
jgi:hypothetical protein